MVSLDVPADPCVIDYHGEFAFPIRPEQFWACLERVERFEKQVGWLSEFRLEGNGLETGSVLWGVITPPLPYRIFATREPQRSSRARREQKFLPRGQIFSCVGGVCASYDPSPFVHLPLRSRFSRNPKGKERTGHLYLPGWGGSYGL